MDIDYLIFEIERNKTLLEQYKRLGAEGALGISVIESGIEFAVKAIETEDPERIKRAYEILKDNT